MMLAMSYVIRSYPRMGERLQDMSSSAFFVYVAHLVLILSLVRGRFYAWGIFETVYGYFTIAFLVVLLSWLPYWALKRVSPKLLSVLVGGRA